MKEATGELSTTVIAIVAIAAVLTIFTVFLLPGIKSALRSKTYCSAAIGCDTCSGGKQKCSYYDDNMNLQVNAIECSCDSDTARR